MAAVYGPDWPDRRCHGTLAVTAAAHYAKATGAAWPLKVRVQSRYVVLGQMAYEARATGKSWGEIGQAIFAHHTDPGNTAHIAAGAHARRTGATWPVKKPNLRLAEIVRHRKTGATWRQIGERLWPDSPEPFRAAQNFYYFWQSKARRKGQKNV